MAPWVTPLPRVSSTTVISPDRMIRSNTARRVGTASACMTASMEAIGAMANQIVYANSLVKAILWAILHLAVRCPSFVAQRESWSTSSAGYEETAETSERITRHVARRTLAEAKRIFPELVKVGENDIRSAWSGLVYYTLDDYPFVERSLGRRLTTFAAPSDHGNALVVKVGQLAGDSAADLVLGLNTEQDGKRHRLTMR